METIWKFELKIQDAQQIEIPKGAIILTVQIQFNTPCLWAKVDPKAPKENRTIKMYRTGHPISVSKTEEFSGYETTYLGTFQVDGGDYVFHVFE